jgi:hypothetical protein
VQISLSLGTGSAECLNQRLGIDCPSMAADLDVFCIAREQARIQGLPCFWRDAGKSSSVPAVLPSSRREPPSRLCCFCN